MTTGEGPGTSKKPNDHEGLPPGRGWKILKQLSRNDNDGKL